MTDDVADHVLRNNYEQTGSLSMLEMSAAQDLDAYGELMSTLESEDKLDRDVEGLPGLEAMQSLKARNGGLTRPEISVLFAYAKNDLFDAIVDGDAPDEAPVAVFTDRVFSKTIARL